MYEKYKNTLKIMVIFSATETIVKVSQDYKNIQLRPRSGTTLYSIIDQISTKFGVSHS